MAKYTLENNFEFEFDLIGIVATVSEYKLCSAINRHLNLDLIREKNIELKHKKQQDILQFSVFCHRDENTGNSFYLINNTSINAVRSDTSKQTITQAGLFDNTDDKLRQQRGKLIPEQHGVDYFLMLEGEFNPSEIEMIKQKLDESEFIQNSQIVHPESLPSKNNLLF